MPQPGSSRTGPSNRRLAFLAAVVLTAVTAGVVALLVNIFERKQEGRNPFYRAREGASPDSAASKLESLQQRGMILLVCNIAATNWSRPCSPRSANARSPPIAACRKPA